MVPCEQHQGGRGAAPQTKKRADRNPRVTRQPIPHIRPRPLPRPVLTFRTAPSWWCGYPAPNRRLARLEPRGRRGPPDALRIFAPPRRSTRRHARPVRSIHHHHPRDLGGARCRCPDPHRSALAGAEAAQIAFGLAYAGPRAYHPGRRLSVVWRKSLPRPPATSRGVSRGAPPEQDAPCLAPSIGTPFSKSGSRRPSSS
jgi:hypothetical protein